MIVSRQQAYVWAQLELKMKFSSATGNPVIPFEISKVEIRDFNSNTLLETITTIVNETGGIYHVITGATWNTYSRIVKDVWFFRGVSWGIEQQAVWTTYVWPSQAISTWALMTVNELLAIPTWVDLSGYTSDQLNFWLEIWKGLIEDYTGRIFWYGTYTDKWETVVDRSGRIVLTTKALPIETVQSVFVWVPGTQKIELQVPYLDIFADKGYMYYNTQSSIGTAMHSAYPSVVLTRADKVSYEIAYETSASIPTMLKQALALIVWNLAKKNKIMQETWVSWVASSISSFKSWDYSVHFWQDTSRSQYTPQGRGTDDLISPDVMEILKKYKFIKQNLY